LKLYNYEGEVKYSKHESIANKRGGRKNKKNKDAVK
jgi:hypothetical protein